MEPDLPVLAILPLESLVIHEHHDKSRIKPLVERIDASDAFINPVIVAPFHDHTARYMVLDGANRTTALKEMGYPHILAQVVEPDSPGLALQTWHHVIWNLNSQRLLGMIQSIPNIAIKPVDPKNGEKLLSRQHALVLIYVPPEEVYAAKTPASNLIQRNNYLNKIVETYNDQAEMDRTNIKNLERLEKLYSKLSGLVIMPPFNISHVMYLASENHKLPPGVTRFIISPRALRVNYPLEELTATKSLEEKNDALNAFIQQRIEKKGVRYYKEETVLYDE